MNEKINAFCVSLRDILADSNKEALKKLNIKQKIDAALERYHWMDEPITRINALIESGDAAKMPGYAYWRLTYKPLYGTHSRKFGISDGLDGISRDNFIPFMGEVWTSKEILRECFFRLNAYLGTFKPYLHDMCIVKKKDFDELICEKFTFQEFDTRHAEFNVTEDVTVIDRKMNYREWKWLRDKKEAFSRKRIFNGRNYPSSGWLLDEENEVIGIYFGDSKVLFDSEEGAYLEAI